MSFVSWRKQYFPTMDERQQMREEKRAKENLENSRRLEAQTQQNLHYRYPEVHQSRNLSETCPEPESFPDQPPPPYEVVVLGHQPAISPSPVVTSQPYSNQIARNSDPPNSPVRPVAQFRDKSIRVTCPACNSDEFTELSYKVGNFIVLVIAVILCFGCFFLPFWACSCIPCCIDSWKDVKHSCPNCGKGLGLYRR